jgi:cysteinyl-tRNA synthetase, unknown class
VTACDKNRVVDPEYGNVDFRQEMRSFVRNLSRYAKAMDADFIVVPQNGQELAAQNGKAGGPAVQEYLEAVDGTGREDLFYGYNADDEPTPKDASNGMTAFCDVFRRNQKEVLVIDYCRSRSKMDDSRLRNQAKGYLSFAAPERDLNVVPDYPPRPWDVNGGDVASLHDARNFLCLINPEKYSSSRGFIDALCGTEYDLVIMDCFFDDRPFTKDDIARLKTKPQGGKRLILSYLSIGEAEDYRYYWNPVWKTVRPAWLGDENPEWEGNYKVRYWDQSWQNIICGGDGSYLKKILDAGFDGVYLDLIDAFGYFEDSS